MRYYSPGMTTQQHAGIQHTSAMIADGTIKLVDLAEEAKRWNLLNRVKLPTPAASDYITPSDASASSFSVYGLIEDFEDVTDWTGVSGQISTSKEGGNYSAYIDTDSTSATVRMYKNDPVDLTNINTLRFWWKMWYTIYDGSTSGRLVIDTVNTFDSADRTVLWEKTYSTGASWLNGKETGIAEGIDVSGYTGNWYIAFEVVVSATNTGYHSNAEDGITLHNALIVDNLAESSNAPSNSRDDDVATYWSPSPENESGAWCMWDTGTLRILSGCRIYFPDASYIPASMKLQVSEDGSSWTDVESIDGSAVTAGAWNEFAFNARYARYLRLVVTDYGAANGVRVSDVDYYSRLVDRVACEHGHGSGVTPHLRGHGVRPFESLRRKRDLDSLIKRIEILEKMVL